MSVASYAACIGIEEIVERLQALLGQHDERPALVRLVADSIDQAVLLGMRLHPTMWALGKQIQASCTTAA